MTSSECFAQAQSHPVDESYGGNPNFLSDVLQFMSNAPDLAPEKESSDNFVNEVLQTECGNDYSTEMLVRLIHQNLLRHLQKISFLAQPCQDHCLTVHLLLLLVMLMSNLFALPPKLMPMSQKMDST